MPKLIITDVLGDQVFKTRIDGGYSVDELHHLAALEARIQVASRGAVTWRVVDDKGRELAAGAARAERLPGLLPLCTPVLYCEAALDAPLAVYGTIAGVQSGHYLVRVDHVDSAGRPVPIGAVAEIRVPLDTPPAGALRTLEAVQLAHQAAAE